MPSTRLHLWRIPNRPSPAALAVGAQGGDLIGFDDTGWFILRRIDDAEPAVKNIPPHWSDPELAPWPEPDVIDLEQWKHERDAEDSDA